MSSAKRRQFLRTQCVNNKAISGSGNGLSPVQCHATIWTIADLLSIGLFGGNYTEMLVEIHAFSFKFF